jgi:hypothetical protein
VFGPDQMVTLLAATALTTALVEAGEVTSAHELGQDTLRRCGHVFGSQHPVVRYLTWVAGSGHRAVGL